MAAEFQPPNRGSRKLATFIVAVPIAFMAIAYMQAYTDARLARQRRRARR